MSNLTREIIISPGKDERATNGGFDGCALAFVLRGDAGVMVFTVSTDWAPLEIQRMQLRGFGPQPRPRGLAFHTDKRLFTAVRNMHANCPYIAGKCQLQAAHSAAGDVRNLLLSGGSEAVWRELERRYELQERAMVGWRSETENQHTPEEQSGEKQ